MSEAFASALPKSLTSSLESLEVRDARSEQRPNPTATSAFVPPLQDAEAARLAGRLNAAQTSPAEERNWLKERETLLKKQMVGVELTRGEMARLQYVRWNLARIEDARVGPKLDELESVITKYESFLSEISRLRRDLDAASKTGRR